MFSAPGGLTRFYYLPCAASLRACHLASTLRIASSSSWAYHGWAGFRSRLWPVTWPHFIFDLLSVMCCCMTLLCSLRSPRLGVLALFPLGIGHRPGSCLLPGGVIMLC